MTTAPLWVQVGFPFAFAPVLRDGSGATVEPTNVRIDLLTSNRWVEVPPSSTARFPVTQETVDGAAPAHLDFTVNTYLLALGSYTLAARYDARSLTKSMTLSIVLLMEDGSAARFEATDHRGDEPHLLREVVRTYQALMAGFSREVGMPASRFALMRLLALSETDLGVMDLARRLGVNAAAVTRQVQELERERLVRRRADPKDGRRRYVGLSPKGRGLFKRIHERSHELERSLSSVIGAEEMANAAVVLVKLRAFVDGRRADQRGGDR